MEPKKFKEQFKEQFMKNFGTFPSPDIYILPKIEIKKQKSVIIELFY